jgi:PIN domain nuclease of toxin-antitoxin system
MVMLDASAVLAFVFDEAGADAVEPALATGVVAAPNWAEVLEKVAQYGGVASAVEVALGVAGVEVEPLWQVDAARAAALWFTVGDLSLADRCCLALAERLDMPVLTADQAWLDRGLDVDVRLVR